jgi:hypothetical protein
MILILAACFIAGPVCFWKDIRNLSSQGVAVFVVGYLVIYVGLFWFYVARYRSVKYGNDES